MWKYDTCLYINLGFSVDFTSLNANLSDALEEERCCVSRPL